MEQSSSSEVPIWIAKSKSLFCKIQFIGIERIK